MKVAINGAGIGGPTLAWWLAEFGHEPVLIEEAPRLRTGGYVIDFWGVGYDVAEKMGLISEVRRLGYQVQEVRFVDAKGRTNGGFPVDVLDHLTKGRMTSLRRSDLSTALYGLVEGRVETIFGDSVAGIEERGDKVHVTFDHAAPRDFDLVVGADGLHSRVRALVFGPEEKFEKDLGYRVAAFEVEGYAPRDELVYVSHTAPGRQVSRFSMREDRTLFLFVFRDEYARAALPEDDEARKAALCRVFGDMGWECPQILAAMREAENIYFDRVSQIHMPRWTKGRTALLGDAAAAVSLLAGEGCGLAMAEAYVLAGELARTQGDHAAAFASYERRMMPFLRKKQGSAGKFAGTFAPKNAFGIATRNLFTRLLRFPPLAEWLIGRDLRDDVVLPDYGR